MTEPSNEQSFKVDWSALQDIPIQFVNQALTQVGLPGGPEQVPDGIQLGFGFVSTPIVVGDEETKREQLDSLGGLLRVQPVARLVMSKERVRELISVLEQALANYEQASAHGRSAHHG